MNKNIEILVNHTQYETRVAILEDGVLQDVFVERERRRGMVGNIYKGRVQRVLPGLDAGFIDIGLDKAGFLHAKNIAKKQPNTPITELLHEGQTVLVQVLKDPIGTKGVRLTTEISIPSRFLVYLPNSTDIGVSFKISEEQREILRQALTQFQNGTGGFIARTALENADLSAMHTDHEYLQRVWATIQENQAKMKVGSLIYGELPLFLKVMRDMVSPNVERIIVDSEKVFEEMSNFANTFLNTMTYNLHLHRENIGLFHRYGIEDEIEQSLKRQVPLKSGGYLIIDETEAMTTIDVNTGAFVGKCSHDDTIYKTNLEASKAIARQLRLRSLGGIIMIDFIDMNQPEHQADVTNALNEALAGDKNKYTISPMSALGIMEMTRKRTHESLRQVMCESCPTCNGLGYVKSAETLVYQIFRDLLHEAREYNPRGLTVRADSDLIEFICEEESIAFADLQALLGIPIELESDPNYPFHHYQIIMH